MTPKRQKVQDYILTYIKKIVTGNENVELYKDMFNSMTDAEFDIFMNKIKNGEIHLSIVSPNDGKIRVSVENNLKIAKELGFDFYQRVKVTNHPDYPDHILPNKFLTMILPIRRVQQLLSKKISIPEHNLQIDQLTGQVTGKSKSAKFSYPEQQIAIAMGLDKTSVELAKVRGGDQGAAKALNDQMYMEGEASLSDAARFSTSVRSTKTLKAYLNAMHIKSTL